MKETSKLSKRHLASQVVFPRLNLDSFMRDVDYANTIIELASSGVGGFCIFGGTYKNAKSIIQNINSYSKYPLLYSCDMENGVAMRIDGATEFPHAMSIGKMNDLAKTYTIASCIAKEAKSIGINWNLAPVTDINSNPNNPIINIRAFGDDLESVVKNSAAYIMGTQSVNVLATAKHFPGHGDSSVDSHLSLPKIDKDASMFKAFELVPFMNAIKTGVMSIMTAHLAIKSIDPSGLPASLSYKITTSLLREAMNFGGIIVTDALDMGALRNNFTQESIIENAFHAGNDVLLMPEDPNLAIDIIENLITRDESAFSQIIESIERINYAKEYCGLFDKDSSFIINEKDLLNHEKYALICAESTIKVYGDHSYLPVKDEASIAGFAVLQKDDLDKPTLFFKILSQAIENDIDFAYINKDIESMDVMALLDGIKNSDIIIFATFFKSGDSRGSVTIQNDLIEVIKTLSTNKKVISINFGNPYFEDMIPADLHILTYSDSLPSIASAILKLSGRSMVTDSIDHFEN